ncbi:serine/threonine protein kinase [Nocardia otitidiscaviarum]|uniref:non-specific serine/threonine protein kinase n=1 Tax=Nocardia otitidiscaviarum TaxID=1823 RepID=A0A378YIE2_9NOCA|nr:MULTISPECIES: serine/threonine-protein kinase [Nocardia]MBF6133700.1 serine/threonine protein kinase [Nocardia otitidiscaviarum]MBF6179736.1 serine/threonine protein kinase [Nocardia otitidiscaviarum]MBF6235662.1 serine/threonine protein kinase [Nocardia otitidiscaviarum]MBF6487728.1 serine/threonine protein kinase [Nocardia otitidiscaviarum]SUA76914.1 Serine/threonine-protein kinase pknB [Nocardia otitidiscaviarum]
MVFRYPAPVTERARPIVGPDYLVAGRYRLQSKIGGGGMGAVWLATDRLLHRDVAIKQVLTTAGLSEEQAEAVRNQIVHEGRVAAKLSHEHAIAVYDVVLEAGEPWLVMEYLPSRSVAKALALVDRLSPIEVAQIGAQVADALAAAHAAGITHRDIKPGNILVADRGDEVGMVKLSDFGISRGVGDGMDDPDVITGTPAYLPPEVARGAQPTSASDVFSLGATLYTAIEGQPPYGFSDDSDAVVQRAAMAQIIPPERTGPLTQALLHMMEPAPQRRPTMTEARNEILTAAFGPGTAPYILGAPVRTEDGTIPAWAARNSAAGLRSPHSTPLPRPPRTQTAAPAAAQRKPKGIDFANLGPNAGPLAVAIGLLIGLLIIIVILVAVM